MGEDQVDLKGLRAERMYYKNTLDKLGIQMEVVHAGKYKDFGDSYTKTAMTPESKEALNALLDGIYNVLVNGIASGRKRSAEEVKKLIDGGPYLAKEALAAKLVDSLEFEHQTIEALARKSNISSKARTSARDYRKIVRNGWESQRSNKIAYLVAEGDIIRGDLGGFGDSGMVASRKFIREVEALRKDDNYAGVVLRIDSPAEMPLPPKSCWPPCASSAKPNRWSFPCPMSPPAVDTTWPSPGTQSRLTPALSPAPSASFTANRMSKDSTTNWASPKTCSSAVRMPTSMSKTAP